MDLARKVGRHLPGPLKGPLTRLYQKWSSKIILNEEMIKNLTEFYNINSHYSGSKLNYAETISLCKVAVKINADLWNTLNPKSEEEIRQFYKIVPYYPFELAYWHMSRLQRGIRKEVISLSFGDVLDYGGGIGDLCVELARKGLDVTYGDVQGRNMEFARWLFKKKGYDIRMIDLEKGKIPDNMMFDTIICIDTIEHISSPEVVLGDIAKHLKNNGRLMMTALNCSGKTEDNPMHLKMEFDAEEYLNTLGIFKADLYWLWMKKVVPKRTKGKTCSTSSV